MVLMVLMALTEILIHKAHLEKDGRDGVNGKDGVDGKSFDLQVSIMMNKSRNYT